MKKAVFLPITLILLSILLLGNAAMPGFWGVGGTGAFIPIFAQDSIHLDKVQMQSERISILLHRGFAVVKGEYYMKNLSQDTINMQTGYPINASLENATVYSIHFDDLYQLKVFQNEKELTATKLQSDTSKIEIANPKSLQNIYNWYTWAGNYAPDTLTKVTVYFMVNTNLGHLREGYSRDNHNGFTYVLESGKAWAKTIEKGQIKIQLGDDLVLEDIKGILPQSTFKANAKTRQLIWDFKELEPESAQNVLIRYTEEDNEFDFEKVEKDAKKYYKELDNLSIQSPNLADFKAFEANDFEVYDWKSGSFFYVLMFLVIFGMPLAIVILGILTIWYFVFKKKKKT